jgi:hypothetical protein
MGGNALKLVVTRRYERTEFEVITNELTSTLKQTFKRVEMPLFYRKKESFGDADYILSMEGYNSNMREYITETFKPNEIFHNGNCYSFDYKELQVDLITVAPEHFDSNYNYLSYNDLGNYIGKIAHGFGFKYGQEGLMYDHYYKGSNIGRIIVSKDYDKIYAFLGLSYNRWKQGFDTLEEIFEFVATSKYFNWEYLQLENNNRVNRERDVKRKSYMSFLEWIEANAKDDNHRYQYEKDKSVYLDAVGDFFPEAGIELEIRRLEYEHCKSLYIKAKFNGGEVMRKYGLQGKELGDAMTGFKQYVYDGIFGDYEECMLQQTKETIYKLFETYLKERKQTV